jgi:hypothetical protein
MAAGHSAWWQYLVDFRSEQEKRYQDEIYPKYNELREKVKKDKNYKLTPQDFQTIQIAYRYAPVNDQEIIAKELGTVFGSQPEEVSLKGGEEPSGASSPQPSSAGGSTVPPSLGASSSQGGKKPVGKTPKGWPNTVPFKELTQEEISRLKPEEKEQIMAFVRKTGDKKKIEKWEKAFGSVAGGSMSSGGQTYYVPQYKEDTSETAKAPAAGQASSQSSSDLEKAKEKNAYMSQIIRMAEWKSKYSEMPGADPTIIGMLNRSQAELMARVSPGQGMSQDEFSKTAQGKDPVAAMANAYRRIAYLKQSAQDYYDKTHTIPPDWFKKLDGMDPVMQIRLLEGFQPSTGNWNAPAQLTPAQLKMVAAQRQEYAKSHPGWVNQWNPQPPAQKNVFGLDAAVRQMAQGQPVTAAPSGYPSVVPSAMMLNPQQSSWSVMPGQDMSSMMGPNALATQMAQQAQMAQQSQLQQQQQAQLGVPPNPALNVSPPPPMY